MFTTIFDLISDFYTGHNTDAVVTIRAKNYTEARKRLEKIFKEIKENKVIVLKK